MSRRPPVRHPKRAIFIGVFMAWLFARLGFAAGRGDWRVVTKRQPTDAEWADVVVTMGNHDARNVGYRHFEDFFGSRDSVTTVDVAEGRARVVAIDSTKPDVDEGERTYQEFQPTDVTQAYRWWFERMRVTPYPL